MRTTNMSAKEMGRLSGLRWEDPSKIEDHNLSQMVGEFLRWLEERCQAGGEGWINPASDNRQRMFEAIDSQF